MLKLVVTADFVAMACPKVALAADLAGTWAIHSDLSSQPEPILLCALKTNGEILSGPCAATRERARLATGYIDKNNMTFCYHTDYNGTGVHLVYHGAFQPNGSLAGKVTSDSAAGVFQAIRLTSDAAGSAVTWKVDVAFSDTLRFVVLCTLHTDGSKLAGPCSVVSGPTLGAKGRSAGSTFSMAYDTTAQGQASHVLSTGTWQSDGSLNGVVKWGAIAGLFTAEKQ